MSFLSLVSRWWNRADVAKKKRGRSRPPLQFDVLESRELLAATVSISAPAFNVNSAPKVVVTAMDANPMVQVAIDVDVDGNTSFSGTGDTGQTTETISLTSGKATTITLNAFPMPYLTSYVVRARVLDSTGAWGTSSVVTMQGPAADTVTLTVPSTLSPTNLNATIQVTAGTNNALPTTAYIDYAPSTSTVFQQLTSVSLSSIGKATVPMTGLPAGTYKLRARIVDPAGHTDLSATPLMTAPAPTVSITAAPFAVGQTPQVTVTATSINPTTQVIIDVGFDGSSAFTNPNDLNQTVESIALVNGQATVINLNPFPEPYLSSYYVRARVFDNAGNTGTSSVVTMRGPQPNTVTFSAPTTVTATNAIATIQVTAGVGNSFTPTAYIDYATATNPTFQQWTSTPLTVGKAIVSLLTLPAGTYQMRARDVDGSGNTVVSSTVTVTIPAPVVSITAPALTVTSVPQVVVTATGVNPIVEVAIDVSLSGSSTFSGPNDLNQTVRTIRLTNGVATPIALNPLLMPYLSSYYVRARVLDSAGNWGTSSVITMQGPKPDTVTLSVPATLTATNNTATVQVTAGQYDALPAGAYIDLDVNNTGSFAQFTSATLNSSGTATIPLIAMPSGTYKIRARIVDPAGNTDVSASLSITVPPPTITITPLPFAIGTVPQVIVTASDLNAITQISFDVALDGSSTFAGSGDMGQTTQSVTLINGQPTTISLNAFPTPYRSTYLIRAHVSDTAGNIGTSSIVTMQGPQPDTVLLTVPTTALTPSASNVNVQVLTGLSDSLPSSVAIDLDLNGVFEQFTTASLNYEGFASIPLQYEQLLPGTYSILAQILDPAGNTDVSTTQTITVAGTTNTSQALTFVPNVGQVTYAANVVNPPNVQFVVPMSDGSMFLSPNELDLSAITTDSSGDQTQDLQSMILVNASPVAQGVGEQLQSSTSNFFVNGLSQTGVANYGEVTFPNVYPNINLSYLGTTGTLEYMFTVNPGASPSSIVLSFPNETPSLDGGGNLVLTLPDGSTVTESRPVVYQTLASGAQQTVLSNFVISNGQVSIAMGSYDPTLPLIIDPYIFTNFLSATATVASAGGMTTDSQGNIYTISNTAGNNFADAGGVGTGSQDCVVTKMSSSGAVVYTTYIGAAGVVTAGHALVVNGAGLVYVTGTTHVPTAPTVFPGFVGTSFTAADFGLVATNQTGFVTILTNKGIISQSSFLGNINTAPTAIALNGFGDVFVAGNTTAFTPPAPYLANVHALTATTTMFLAKFSPGNITTTGFLYADLMGGSAGSAASVLGMSIDAVNRIYLVGQTTSKTALTVANPFGQTFAVPAAAQQSKPYIAANAGGSTVGFDVQLQENTSAAKLYAILTYSTYIGSAGSVSNVSGIAVTTPNAPNQAIANMYLTGTTNAIDTGTGGAGNFFQLPAQGLVPTHVAGDTKAYILELRITANPGAGAGITTQVTGTFIGNAGHSEVGDSIALDTQGDIYVDGSVPAGEITSAFFNTNPVQPFPAVVAFTNNTFLVEFNATAKTILTGTLIGGNTAGEIDQSAGVVGAVNVGCVSMVVASVGTIFISGLTNNYASFQGVVKANGGTSLPTLPVPGAGFNTTFVTKLGPRSAQIFGPDQFEPNDTSNVAASLGSPSTNALGQLSWGPFPNLNTFRHADGLFDYDWYQVVPPQAGLLTVTISNIAVVASGPNPVYGAAASGDLDLYVYQMINGFLYLLGSSILVNSPTQTVAVNVAAGADILFEVNPYNYTQATYTMGVTLQ